MSQRRDNNFHAHDFNPDERLESVVNDTTASAGDQMGVRVDVNPESFTQPQNPLHLNPKVDLEMEKFKKFFEGNKK